MKHTLEEAAKEYANENCWIPEELHDSEIPDYMEHFAKHFIAGAEWQAKQSPWISVEEQLPETSTMVLTKGAYGFLICYLSTLGEWETGANVNEERLAITHWCPIPSFDEILEANRDVLERIKEKEVDHGHN